MLNRFARFSLAISEIDRCWHKLAAEQVQQRAALAVELAGSGMTDADREVFYRCLERITINLQTLSKEGLPQQ